MIRLIFNLYTDPDKDRENELKTARRINQKTFDEVVPVLGRPTFREMFALANERANSATVTVIANADISFDETIREAEKMNSDECWCLTRWENGKIGGGRDCFDSWVFKDIIRQEFINACDFLPGIPGCDNSLAWHAQRHGYKVSNPSLTIMSEHHHACGIRRYDSKVDKIKRPYLLVTPHKLGEKPKLDIA